MRPIIKVENLGKQYQIGAKAESYGTIREAITNTLRHPFSSFRNQNSEKDCFWAIRDLSFEVMPGEIVGIIGRNGAGKSTLLKILSRITEPTVGKAELYGRVGSLLEVGTGFHPELTGRENVFLNGAILGMSRQEIAKKFDEIVNFAEVEKFIDTPVKHYSSGMYMRLAFAIAANLEPEILIVDEVLAVGDVEFQKKCLGKMNEVNQDGRTVLFVSHNMGTIAQLCGRTLVLDKGALGFDGKTDKAIDFYATTNSQVNKVSHKIFEEDEFQFITVFNCNESIGYQSEFRHDSPIRLFAEIYIPRNPKKLDFAVSLYDKHKRRVFTIHEPLGKFYDGGKTIKLITVIPANFITPGYYSWLMCINDPNIKLFDLQDDICGFTVLDAGSDFASIEGLDYGPVFVNHTTYSVK